MMDNIELEVRIINGKEVTLSHLKQSGIYLVSEEAIEILLKAFETNEQQSEAVKKQTPMQIWGNKHNPVNTGDTVNGLCPICNTEFICITPRLYEEHSFGYCKQCGQKLAWDNPTIYG